MTDAISKRIVVTGSPITQAMMTITGTGTFTPYLSADDGTNYEAVNSGIMHTFTNTGNYLRWKISLNSGAVITRVEVDY